MIIRIIVLININTIINEVLFEVMVISKRLPSSSNLQSEFATYRPV